MNKQENISKTIRVSLWPPSIPDLNPIDYATRGILENKTNETSCPNIGLLHTDFEEECKTVQRIYFEGMQIISKVCWYNNWKNGSHIE